MEKRQDRKVNNTMVYFFLCLSPYITTMCIIKPKCRVGVESPFRSCLVAGPPVCGLNSDTSIEANYLTPRMNYPSCT